MQPGSNQALVNKLKLPNTQVRWFTLSSKKKEEKVEIERKSKSKIKAKESKRQQPLTAREERKKQRAKDSRSRSNIGDTKTSSRRGRGRRGDLESSRSRSSRKEDTSRASKRGAPESVVSKKSKYQYNKENTVITPKNKAFPIKTESSDNVIKRKIRTQVWHFSKSRVKQNSHLMKLLADNKINIDDINVSRLHLNDLDMETIGIKNGCLKQALLWLFR